MPDINSWHDYFVMVGGGSAALTGLIFVAMTLHLNEITTNPVHRHRAHHLDGPDGRFHSLRPGAHGRSELPRRGARDRRRAHGRRVPPLLEHPAGHAKR